MPKLYRPHIPVSVRVQVAERQLLDRFGALPDRVETPDGRWLAVLLPFLAESFGCELSELRLDHDPPLGARPRKDHWKGDDVLGLNKFSVYQPAANDPDHLFYRPHGAQHAGSHDIKTRVRGDHGQFSDLALIKRERRRLKKKAAAKNPKKKREKKRFPKPQHRWPSRPFPKRRAP